jgi:1,4-dihydroxy-2-naphthoyl-CoA hydrolase
MFNEGISVEKLNALGKGCMVAHLGIEFTQVGSNFLVAKMPVDHRTHQPFGMLHGGASVVLAETLGSIGANCLLNPHRQYAVGLDINANHIRAVKTGFVYGKAQPLHVGKGTQVWEITITNEADELVCISRLTMAILDKK